MNKCCNRCSSTSKQTAEGKAFLCLCTSQPKFFAASILLLSIYNSCYIKKKVLGSPNNVYVFICVCLCSTPVQNMTDFIKYCFREKEAVVQVPNLKIFMHTDPV